MTKNAFTTALARAVPMILDGGLATQLEAQGCDIGNALWSASLLRSNPAAIVSATRAYLDAGAECVATASYQASREGFATQGLSAEAADALMLLSVQLAEQARDEYLQDNPGLDFTPLIAGSLGPYGAMLADGSEYHGRYGLTVGELRDFHRPRMEVLAAAGADVLAFETLPNAAEVEAVLIEVEGTGIDCWVSVSIEGSRIRSGELLLDVAAMVADVDEVMAFGINCSTPSDATEAVSIAARSGKPVVIYPNSGEGWDADNRTWVAAETAAHFPVSRWTAEGSRLVGGCCRITPSDISALAVQLAQ